MRAPETAAVMDALDAAGAAPRFVGGCVRDTLIGQRVRDVDIATPLRPEAVIERLRAAGLKAVPTGLAHGTVTGVSGGRPFEITTLRRDMETDGRHAVVAFTEDWREDAARRDFTINAMSLERDGTLHDYFDGRDDLEAGRVRFVGEPARRIDEDRLRLLRFYRFHAYYGRIGTTPTAPDPAAREACRAMAPRLGRLSAERVGAETRRLLQAPEPGSVLRVMAEDGILDALLDLSDLPGGAVSGAARVAALVTLEGITVGADWRRRLAALLMVDAPGGAERAARATKALVLSNPESRHLSDLATADERISPDLAPRVWRAALYRLGLERFHDLALLAWAAETEGESSVDRFETERWCALFRAAGQWTPPRFPLAGADVVAAGVPAGPRRGEVLRAVEAWWIAGDFEADRAACLVQLARAAAGEAD